MAHVDNTSGANALQVPGAHEQPCTSSSRSSRTTKWNNQLVNVGEPSGQQKHERFRKAIVYQDKLGQMYSTVSYCKVTII
jgi:hypothetical protein